MIKTQIKSGYCSIPVLYDRIAEALDLTTLNAHYNCTKVCVSPQIFDAVSSYYSDQKVASETIAMWWLNYGPKAIDTLKDNEVTVEDGWYKIS